MNGKVPSSQLPSYVDDVLEYSSTSAFPVTGETGKIYVDTTTNKTYRWGGSAYVEISASLALGDTSSTAYYGDKGKTAYDHATDSSRLTTSTSSGLYKVASTAQGHIASLTAVAKSDITALGIPGSDTNTHRAINVNGTQLLGDNTTALNIASGSNVTLTPDTSTGKVTIAATDTNTHRPIQVNGTQVLGDNTTALNLKAGSNVSLSNSSGTVTIAATNTTYSAATQSAAGLMSAADKTKLDGIASSGSIDPTSFISTIYPVSGSLFYQGKHIFGYVELSQLDGRSRIGDIESAYAPSVNSMSGAVIANKDGQLSLNIWWSAGQRINFGIVPSSGSSAMVFFDYLMA